MIVYHTFLDMKTGVVWAHRSKKYFKRIKPQSIYLGRVESKTLKEARNEARSKIKSKAWQKKKLLDLLELSK